ncbi:MAG: hypothetical protein RLY14_3107 [Planctomycetota bacterium]|jgi:serine/threonine protein kinase
MAGMFKPGDKLVAQRSRRIVTINEFLGSGGQGEVYRVDCDSSELALKWYFDHTATDDQRKGIEKLTEDGPPGQHFLWPMELVVSTGSSSFGYLMPLREKRFRSFTDLVNGRLDPSFETLVVVGLNLVDSFHKLHAAGLCYRDISFGNGFFDPSTGETLICDNDNVSANNSPSKSVLGTPDFMAPEIVVGKARPSRLTDYFSLSVLLFYLFHIQHPLLGKKILSIRSWDLPAREKLFGFEPVFIFDPNNLTNAAIDDPKIDPLGEAGKNAIPYWNNIYPRELKDAFTTSFTHGLHSPDRRVLATTWKKVLSNTWNSIYSCHCKAQVFHDTSLPSNKCWKCNRVSQPSFFLQTDQHKIAVKVGKKLFQSHLAENSIDFSSPVVGEVVAHPSRKDVFGLQNKMTVDWTAQPAGGGAMIAVSPGKSIPLVEGTIVFIGNHRVIMCK